MKSSLRIIVASTTRVTLVALLLVTFLPAMSFAVEEVQLPLKTIEVKHFTQADALGLSQDFVNYFYDGLRLYLPKAKVAELVVDEGATVPEADAANSVIVEGKFMEFKKGFVGIVTLEINLYRRSDHKLIITITPKVPFKSSPFNTDKSIAHATGGRTAYEIKKALK